MEYLKGNEFERYGMIVPDPKSKIRLGEHVNGSNQSWYLSASTLPKGAPDIKGFPQFIDIDKAKKAGCKIHSTETIVADLKRLQAEFPNSKSRLDKLINTISNSEKEVLIENPIPPEAIKSGTAMKWVKRTRVLNVIGIAVTAYNIEQAAEISIKESSAKPLAAQTIREAGGWALALAGAKVGALAGIAVGIETGPGAIITGAVGALVFGTLGYFGFDILADFIYENE